DPVGGLRTLLILEGDGGAEVDAALIGLLGGGDDGGGVQAPLEEADAAVDLAQALLAVDVPGILRAVALRRGGRHLGGPLGALLVEQAQQLAVHALRTGAGEIAALRATLLLGLLILFVMLGGYVLTHAPCIAPPREPGASERWRRSPASVGEASGSPGVRASGS